MYKPECVKNRLWEDNIKKLDNKDNIFGIYVFNEKNKLIEITSYDNMLYASNDYEFDEEEGLKCLKTGEKLWSKYLKQFIYIKRIKSQ